MHERSAQANHRHFYSTDNTGEAWAAQFPRQPAPLWPAVSLPALFQTLLEPQINSSAESWNDPTTTGKSSSTRRRKDFTMIIETHRRTSYHSTNPQNISHTPRPLKKYLLSCHGLPGKYVQTPLRPTSLLLLLRVQDSQEKFKYIFPSCPAFWNIS